MPSRLTRAPQRRRSENNKDTAAAMEKAESGLERLKRELIGTEFKDMNAEKWRAIVRRALGELFATATLVFIGCMGLVGGLSKAPDHFAVAFNFGIAVMAGLITFSHVSGAHMNPGLSLTAMILGKLSLPMWFIYSVFQCLGAVLGYVILMGITPSKHFVTNPKDPMPNLCCNAPNPLLSMSQAFWSEFVFSALLSLLACAVWDRRNLDKHDSVSLRFGLGVFAIAYGGVQYSGCSMNPARSFGPALVWNYWDNHWLYWVAPLLANIVVATFYRLVFPEPRPAPVE